MSDVTFFRLICHSALDSLTHVHCAPPARSTAASIRRDLLLLPHPVAALELEIELVAVRPVPSKVEIHPLPRYSPSSLGQILYTTAKPSLHTQSRFLLSY